MTSDSSQTKHRNTASLVSLANPMLTRAVDAQLMHITLQEHQQKCVQLPDGRHVIEFINCSYLGLDLHPDVIAGAQQILDQWGVHLCCARSRFSIGPNRELEEGLSELFRGRAITFPSVTTAHMSVLPLIASGVLLHPTQTRPVRAIFDRFAHASMQYLKPIMATEAEIHTIPHNDLDALAHQVQEAHQHGQQAVYLCDGVYSMGGLCPVKSLLDMAQALDFYLYIDDAHGTSIFGERGEGYVLSQIEGPIPACMFVNFSLAKGFGCNGGGIILPDTRCEQLVRRFGQTYIFSAPLDFSLIGAALASLQLHHNGTVRQLQQILQHNIATFLYGESPIQAPTWAPVEPLVAFLTWREQERTCDHLGPIRMVLAGEPERAIRWGETLIEHGYFVSTAFFPVVPQKQAQLRIAITASHTHEQILGLRAALDQLRLSS